MHCFRDNVATPTLEVALLFDKAVKMYTLEFRCPLHFLSWLRLTFQVLKPRFCESHFYFNILNQRLVDAWMCLAAYLRFNADNAPQQCIQYQATCCFCDVPRFFQSSELVPLKAMAHAIMGAHEKPYIFVQTAPGPSVLMSRVWSRTKMLARQSENLKF